MNHIHIARRDCICHHCGKGFKTNCNLKEHLQTHSEGEECPICHKKVSFLEKHLRRHKKPIVNPKFPCELCGKEFSKFQLKAHVARIHEKAFQGKLFPCDQCSLEFTRQDLLRQ